MRILITVLAMSALTFLSTACGSSKKFTGDCAGSTTEAATASYTLLQYANEVDNLSNGPSVRLYYAKRVLANLDDFSRSIKTVVLCDDSRSKKEKRRAIKQIDDQTEALRKNIKRVIVELNE